MTNTARRKRRFRIPTGTLFTLGQTVATPNALGTLSPAAISNGLCRHASGDWGNLCQEDAELNIESFHSGNRILSAYGKGDKRF